MDELIDEGWTGIGWILWVWIGWNIWFGGGWWNIGWSCLLGIFWDFCCFWDRILGEVFLVWVRSCIVLVIGWDICGFGVGSLGGEDWGRVGFGLIVWDFCDIIDFVFLLFFSFLFFFDGGFR